VHKSKSLLWSLSCTLVKACEKASDPNDSNNRWPPLTPLERIITALSNGCGVLACIQPDGRTAYEEPTAEERELAMDFPEGSQLPRRFQSIPGGSYLGRQWTSTSVMWVFAAARSAGARRLPLGGEAVSVRPLAAGGVTQTHGIGHMVTDQP
jgi:hypothetical protein